MKLTDQVVSLELAKRLKELGVKQESYFWWEEEHNRVLSNGSLDFCPARIVPRSYYDGTSPKSGYVAAFTVAELHALLPEYVSYSRHENCWFTEADHIEGEEREDFQNRCFTDENEAESAGNCLAYLLGNKLI